MEQFSKATRQFYDGLHKARSLMPQLTLLSLRMLAQADQLEAARETLIAGNLKFKAAADQLAAVAEQMRGVGLKNPLDKGHN